RASSGTLENAMLDEVRDAVKFIGLVAGADTIEEPERCAADTLHSVGEHHKAVFKASFFDVFLHRRTKANIWTDQTRTPGTYPRLLNADRADSAEKAGSNQIYAQIRFFLLDPQNPRPKRCH